jgi:GntR family transcriptional regulator / MocR family aminotransferase
VSKLLAPALRVGWILPPRRYAGAIAAAKHDADLGNALLPQLVLGELMESGELERQLRLVRRRHRRRRDAMIDAVRTHLPSVRMHGAAAGLHLMITFDATFADTDLAARSLARGVKVHPLSWHSQRRQPPGLVLGYAASTVSETTEGVAEPPTTPVTRQFPVRPYPLAFRPLYVGWRPVGVDVVLPVQVSGLLAGPDPG